MVFVFHVLAPELQSTLPYNPVSYQCDKETYSHTVEGGDDALLKERKCIAVKW